MARIDHAINVDDVQRLARRRVPRPVYDAVTGGAGDEVTLRANRAALQRIRLLPRAFTDTRDRRLTTTVLGEPISMPVVLAPTGFQRMCHRDAELATARAAGRAGTAFVLAASTSQPLEDVAAAATGPRWFQLYLGGSRPDTSALLDRARAAGYRALCITVDTPVFGLRERDRRNHLTVPLRLHPRTVAAAATRPGWSADFLRGVARLRAAHRRPAATTGPLSIREGSRAIARLAFTVTPEDLAWVRRAWDGPVIVKGVLRPDDAVRAVDAGADAVVVSNHGGRQLDTVPGTMDVLAAIVDAVADRAEVHVDGGFRRGTDVAKALAVGARTVWIGKPYVYGLAAAGERGVTRVLEILRAELDTTLALLGCPTVTDVDRSRVWAPAPAPLASWEPRAPGA